MNWASLSLFGRPSWVRWIILLPAIGLSALVLIFTFNVIFRIGDWFGDSFVGAAWMWGTTFFQAAVVPSTLVTTGFLIAPTGRRWIAIAVMLAIWAWLAGPLLSPDTGDFLAPDDAWVYGWLVIAAGAAAYAAINAWGMAPTLQLLELDMRLDADMPAYCHNCGTEAKPYDRFCTICGVALGKA